VQQLVYNMYPMTEKKIVLVMTWIIVARARHWLVFSKKIADSFLLYVIGSPT